MHNWLHSMKSVVFINSNCLKSKPQENLANSSPRNYKAQRKLKKSQETMHSKELSRKFKTTPKNLIHLFQSILQRISITGKFSFWDQTILLTKMVCSFCMPNSLRIILSELHKFVSLHQFITAI